MIWIFHLFCFYMLKDNSNLENTSRFSANSKPQETSDLKFSVWRCSSWPLAIFFSEKKNRVRSIIFFNFWIYIKAAYFIEAATTTRSTPNILPRRISTMIENWPNFHYMYSNNKMGTKLKNLIPWLQACNIISSELHHHCQDLEVSISCC